MIEIALPDLTSTTYAFCDPAAGKTGAAALKRTRARSALVVVSADWLIRIYVRHAWAERCSTDRLIDRIFEVNERFHPRVFGIEANAMQSLFADGIVREGRHRGIRIPVVPVQQPTKIEKDFRIRASLQPVIAEGRLLIPETQEFVELRSELSAFPLGMVKDLVDALASVVSLCPRRAPGLIRSEEAESLARYLRGIGASPDVIESRVAALVGNALR